MVEKLEGCDERSLVLDGNHLVAGRWGSERHRVALVYLTPGQLLRDDKEKIFRVFGKAEERVRIDFGDIEIAVWVPLERQGDAEVFVARVNEAIENDRA